MSHSFLAVSEAWSGGSFFFLALSLCLFFLETGIGRLCHFRKGVLWLGWLHFPARRRLSKNVAAFAANDWCDLAADNALDALA